MTSGASPSGPDATLGNFTVPRLTTERLLLREPQTRDFTAYAEHMCDAEATQYMGGALDRRAAWRAFLVGAGSWIVTGSGWWTLEERVTGAIIGTVGAFFREANIDRGRDADLELGWVVFRPFAKRGFAREAAGAALAWSLARHDPARVIAHISKENVASIAVSRALGMAHVGEVDFYGEPTELYAIERNAATD